MERNTSVFAIFINTSDAHNPINGGMKLQQMYLKAVVSLSWFTFQLCLNWIIIQSIKCEVCQCMLCTTSLHQMLI